jgi:hypothetical protein
MLRGGRRPVDVYRHIYNGTYGTPMPGFKSKFSESPDTIWRLAHFIISISEGREFKLVEADPEDMSTSETSSGD